MADFKLEAIHCKNCGSGLVVELNDYVTYCSSCGSGFELTDFGLIPIEVNFAAPVLPAEGDIIYKPFWLVKTHIEILNREASGGFISNIFGGSGQATSGDITFYIPAFYCSLDAMKHLAQNFTVKNPVASPQKFNSKITGFAYGKEDAKKLSEFILISIEAEKKDTMKNFEYRIDYNAFEVLGIPFYRLASGRVKDAVLGIEF
jgi:hypothetical protein